MIPDTVTSIGSEAFYYGSLLSVTLPATITSYSGTWFAMCTHLIEVNYGGTKAAAQAMLESEDYDGDYNPLPDAVWHCSDGDILPENPCYNDGDYSYFLNTDGTATVCDYVGDGTAIIPTTLGGYTVTSIDSFG